MGRPTKYDSTILKRVKEWAKKGLSDAQIAQNLDVSRSTLSDWKNRFPDFLDVITKGKDIADRNVVNSVYKAAQFSEVTEEHTHIKKDANGKEIKEIRRVKKIIPPNPALAIFWLKNRLPDDWRDRREDLIAMVSKEELQKSANEIQSILNKINANNQN